MTFKESWKASAHLTEVDFTCAPQEIIKYEIGSPISRENFVSFFMKSFAVSRGRIEVQLLFFKWIQRKQGFDFLAALGSLLLAGGWNAFTPEEQKMFLDGFRHIKKHTDKWLDFEYEDEIINEIEGVVMREVAMGRSEEFIDIETIDTFSEFVSATSNYIEQNPLT